MDILGKKMSEQAVLWFLNSSRRKIKFSLTSILENGRHEEKRKLTRKQQTFSLLCRMHWKKKKNIWINLMFCYPWICLNIHETL